MVFWCYILAGSFGVLVALYGLLEIHYFLRMCLCVIYARFVKQKVNIFDTTTVTGICLTTDIDTFLYHMNNSRYLRELDFARADFYETTRLYRTIIKKGGSVVQGAATIRYRRFIRPFSIYRITSKIVYWDDKSIFMEHQFISPKDNFIHCIAVCKQRFIDCSVEQVITELLETFNDNNNKNQMKTDSLKLGKIENGNIHSKICPELPLDISKWIEYNDISSKNLRND